MKFLALVSAMLLLSGCALTVSDPRALKPMDSFAPLASDSRVWVEPGYEAYGERVAEALPAAVRSQARRARTCAAATPVSSATC